MENLKFTVFPLLTTPLRHEYLLSKCRGWGVADWPMASLSPCSLTSSRANTGCSFVHQASYSKGRVKKTIRFWSRSHYLPDFLICWHFCSNVSALSGAVRDWYCCITVSQSVGQGTLSDSLWKTTKQSASWHQEQKDLFFQLQMSARDWALQSAEQLHGTGFLFTVDGYQHCWF